MNEFRTDQIKGFSDVCQWLICARCKSSAVFSRVAVGYINKGVFML